MTNQPDQNIGKDIKKILFHYLSYYKLFAGAVLAFVIAAYFYNKTLVPTYQNSASIHLVKDRSSFFTTDFSFETSLASPQMGMRMGMGLDDELAMLNSFATVQKTLKELNYEIKYFTTDSVFKRIPGLRSITRQLELYTEVPVKVEYDASHVQAIYKEFTLKVLSDTTFQLKCSAEGGSGYNYIDDEFVSDLDGKTFNVILPFNKVFENEMLKIRIQKTPAFNYWPKNKPLGFTFQNLDYLTLEYQSMLILTQPTPQSFIINAAIKGKNYYKITDFLNTFIENVLQNDLDQKNILASSTISFIDAQLGDITDSLDRVKTNLERFRSTNKVTDLSFQGQRLFDQMAQLENERTTLRIQKRYYTYLVQLLENESDNKELISPESMNVIDPLLSNMISQLSTLYAQYNNYKRSSSATIYLSDIKIKIDNQEKAILENSKNNLNTIELNMSELDYRVDKLNKEISALPKTELKLFDIEREFKLNDAVLTFLMQKRSEAQIAMASTQPSYDIVEPARFLGGNPVAPKKSLNYIIAFMLGIFIPFAYILITDFLDYRIRSKYDINDIQKYTFLGNIYNNPFTETLCTIKHPDSAISESFRAVRTNLQFMLDFSASRMFAITSTSSGEGKSFFAANLAASYASSNRSTILLEFDLRRPQVGKMFQVKNLLGLTSYLSNNANIDDVVQKTEVSNLDIILAGDHAPNPADLIASDKVQELFDYLRASYEVIIVDTAPVGIVSESFHLMRHADLNLFIVRRDFSHRELVNQTVSKVEQAEIGKFGMVLNDVSRKSITTYKQANYVKYYTDEPTRLSLFRNVKFKK